MLGYIVRRVLYAIPTLIGVMLVTYFLFFGISSPETIARKNLSTRNPKPQQIQQWLKDHGYDKPKYEQLKSSTVDMMLFKFGKSDTTGEQIWDRIKQGAGPSLVVGGLVFFIGLAAALLTAVIAAYFRGTYVDGFITFFCVLLMSVVYIVYVIGLQFVLGKLLRLGPIAGWDSGWGMVKFLVLPVAIGVISGLGADIRLYRTFLLDETNQDYVRTGAGQRRLRTGGLAQTRFEKRADAGHHVHGRRNPDADSGQPGAGKFLRDSRTRQLPGGCDQRTGFLSGAGRWCFSEPC